MRRCTHQEKVAGEMAARSFGWKAEDVYSGTSPLELYEYEVDGDKLYAIRGCLGDVDDLTFSEVEYYFESMYDEWNSEE